MRGGLYFWFSRKSVFLKDPSTHLVSGGRALSPTQRAAAWQVPTIQSWKEYGFIPAECNYGQYKPPGVILGLRKRASVELDQMFVRAGEGLKAIVGEMMTTIVWESDVVGDKIRDGLHHLPGYLAKLARRHWDVCLNLGRDVGWICLKKVIGGGGGGEVAHFVERYFLTEITGNTRYPLSRSVIGGVSMMCHLMEEILFYLFSI